MYDYNLTAQEISDYNADMLEMRGELLALQQRKRWKPWLNGMRHKASYRSI